ncbi:MAG: hypothetical protein QOF25_508 [Mycobacterium sp.]|jgi:hypothetical protein|nr:hypothetical protein [Mycobacterium sp.]
MKRRAIVGIKPSRFTLLMAAGGVAAAIVTAPIAAAAPAAMAAGDAHSAQQSCNSLGGTQTECQAPGTAQLYDAPPQVDYFTYAGGET